MRILDHILKKLLRDAAVLTQRSVAPACILWPDHDRQWEAVIQVIQAELPELFILGDYEPDKRLGPAIWLRCVIAGSADEISLPRDHPPILYLPGVSRQDLRDIEKCPDSLRPLAELQYRGVIWSQINSKDWTILAFFKSDQGGLGLDVAQDNDTKNAMQLALYRLLDEDVSLLKGKHLDRDYFNTLLTGGDPIRDLLHWLDQGGCISNKPWRKRMKLSSRSMQIPTGLQSPSEGILAGSTRLANHRSVAGSLGALLRGPQTLSQYTRAD